MEARDYTVKSWKPWENEEGLIRDMHGNYKGSVLFDEYSSEPVDGTFKTQPQIGDKKFGTIDEYETKAGATRQKFTRADRLEEPKQTFSTTTSTKTSVPLVDWDGKDRAIKAQFAIKAAIQHLQGTEATIQDVEASAKSFFAMVDRVKAGEPKLTDPKVIAEALGIEERQLVVSDIPD